MGEQMGFNVDESGKEERGKEEKGEQGEEKEQG